MNAPWMVLGGGVGLVAGGVVGGVAGSFSVFGWEAWAALVVLLAAVAGLVAGTVTAVKGPVAGGLSGAIPLGVLFAAIGARASANGTLPPDDSWGIPVWGTAAVIAAAFVAASISSLLRARQRDARSPADPKTIT